MNVEKLLSGGFLDGYKTYILAAAFVVTAFADFAVGDLGLTEFLLAVFGGSGIGALRHSNAKVEVQAKTSG